MVSPAAQLALLASVVPFAAAQDATGTERILSTLSPQVNAAPSLTPTVRDPTAPEPQDCPGYKASNVADTAQGFTADLTMAGAACQAFGNDIADLVLNVEYQTRDRLNVQIYPRNVAPSNYTQFILDHSLVYAPTADGCTTAAEHDLTFTWDNEPSFQFKINRETTGEELFSTYGHVIVFEDQFLEMKTNMVDDYNVYGLAENTRDFRLGTNATQAHYAVDAGNTIDGNSYGTHPFFQETRYHEGANTTAHGVYARNAHGQEWLLRNKSITYRTLGGSFDMYFLSGQKEDGSSSALETIRQYQTGCIGTPAMQMYWTLGYHQARWGYQNISVLQGVVDRHREAKIPLECIWNDLDVYYLYRNFDNDEETYPAAAMQEFLAALKAGGQYYVPIVDSNIYAPNPANASDAYETFQRGAELEAYIRDPTTEDFYYGAAWPGFSVWGDFLLETAQQWWTESLLTWHKETPFDGVWIDLSEAASFCSGSCGNGRIEENPVHPPFLLPGDPLNEDFRYPEGFNVTNATEAAAASSGAASQSAASSASPILPEPTTSTLGRTEPTPGVRNLNYPPYMIDHVQDGHALVKSAIAPNATHNDQFNTTEYELHNLYGHHISNATYHALLDIFPNRRPFTVGRSTFSGSGNFTAHWGGDNTSTWGSMFLSIAQALQFMMAGIPMFGADVCGFAGNTDYQLCSRWAQLGAFMPFYRNHNVRDTRSQEFYIWSSTAEAARRAMHVRYSLIDYMYTLLYYANTKGETVNRALAWEFPNDASLAGTYNQFMLGPSILVTPVLQPNVDYVNGVFPGVEDGEIWYDWYTLQPIDAKPQENVTLSAPLEHINVHVRGGSVLPLHEPGYTTGETRDNPHSLTVALDQNGEAKGTLYLDDGVSLVQETTKMVEFTYAADTLSTAINGNHKASAPLANVTIAGAPCLPKHASLTIAGEPCAVSELSLSYAEGVLYVTGLEAFTGDGAFEGEMEMKFEY
ncbi:hypothetical protein MBLNU230_g0367t1 [Neophaeotheca triangularis]